MIAAETRETIASHVFHGPFRIAGYDEAFPPGNYDVITREAIHQGIERTAYVRTSTTLIVKTLGLTRHCDVDYRAFQTALTEDVRAAPSEPSK